MKKNKPRGNGVEASGTADRIATEALETLASKLKADLAKPAANPKPASTEKSKKRKDSKPERQRKEVDSKPLKKKDEKNGKEKDGGPKGQKVNGHKGNDQDESPRKSGASKKASKKGDVDSQPSKGAQEPASIEKKSTKARREGRRREGSKSLLEEILALGGTREDLELIEDVSSDEDLVGQRRVAKAKGEEDSLRRELQKQMKELGLTGQFPDASDEEEEEVDSDWTDENQSEVSPPLTAEPKTKPKNEPPKPNIIDRPLQLSTPSKYESKPSALSKNTKLKITPIPIWYSIEHAVSSGKPANAEIISHLQARGKFLLQAEAETYSNSSHISASDRQFLSTIMTSGTQSDKLSALTLSVSSSPIHHQKQLDALLNLAKKKSRNEAVQAVASIKDLLVGNLLPDDRKLMYFSKQALRESPTDEELILYTFEDWLKGWYFQVLQTIEGLSMDPLPFVRNHMISYIFDLLRDRPEQEQLLLRILVNKLGDGSKKIAAKTSYFLLQLQASHPQMKSIVLHEMENLLFKPNTSVHAQYYTIITMNQTVLTSRDIAVANRLIEVYFMLFVKLLRGGTSAVDDKKAGPKKKKRAKGAPKRRRGGVNWDELNQQEEEVNSKNLSAVLTGVNRAFPFSKVESDVFEKHMDVLFMITHDANFNTAVQALILIYQVATAKQIVLDRYYRTLYESLLDRRLATSSKQALYLNLLFKSLRSDINVARIKAFMKRIVHITSIHSPGFTCAVLYLISELVSSRPDLRSLWTPPPNTVTEEDAQASVYDPRKRDPQFANADAATLWELSPLLSHYHPAVQLYAENLLSHRPNATKPDLALHTVKHFLDRFVYRNPKSKNLMRGNSIMQPLATPNTSLVLNVRGNAKSEVAVNSEDWWRQQVDKIRPDEVFFHRYFVAKEEDEVRRAAGKKRKRGDEDEGSEIDEDEIFEALVKSSKEEGGLGNEEVDIDGSDDDDEIEWSDEELDEDMIGEMNEEMSDLAVSDEAMDEDIEEDVSEEEGDVDAFFDDEAEEVDEDDNEEEEEWNGVSNKEDDIESVTESEGSDNADGRFEFGDDESDIVGSDEDITVPTTRHESTKADRSKKRKLKNLPIFASAEDYAALLED